MGNKHIISPIAIDMGAAYTGVYSGKLIVDAEIKIDEHANLGQCISMSKDSITFMQKNRTQKRHQSRNQKRKILAKRLMCAICNHYGVDNQNFLHEINFVRGLMNRRGYTFISEILEESLYNSTDISEFLLNQIDNLKLIDNLSQYSTILDFFIHGIIFLDMDCIEKLHEYFSGQEFKDEFKNNFKDFEKKIIEEIAKNIIDYLVKIRDEKQLGAKHRSSFLEDICNDIKKVENGFRINKRRLNITQLYKKLQLKNAEQLANLIGNISNLQLRVLRKYFNDESMKKEDKWDSERLFVYYRKWIVSWHTKKLEEKERQKKLLNTLNEIAKNHNGFFTWLITTAAKDTIPPYEDMKNRNIPKCKSLYLNPVALDKICENWEHIVEKLVNNLEEKTDIDIKENLRDEKGILLRKISSINGIFLDEHSNKNIRQERAYLLQRILDISKDIDIYDTRLIVKETFYSNSKKSLEQIQELEATLKSVLSDKEFDNFITFAHKYYNAIEEARSGIWDDPKENIEYARNNMFWVCNTNPPHKNKLAHELIGNLLGIKFQPEDWDTEIVTKKENAYSFWASPNDTLIGIKSYKNLAKKFEETRKEYGNRFKQMLEYTEAQRKKGQENKIEKDLESILKIFENNPDIYKNFVEGVLANSKNSISNTKDYAQKSIISVIYIFSQIYTILEQDSHGFSKSCKFCVQENNWRSTFSTKNTESTRAVRLTVDSVRPFDGYLGRYIERLSNEIFEFKKKEIESIIQKDKVKDIYIPILIEENSFEFEQSLAKDLKNVSNSKKITKLEKKNKRESGYIDQKILRIQHSSESLESSCPYCGKTIIQGEIDHIIPSSYTKKIFHTTFNSEANLIYCCKECNQQKQKTLYTLKNLNTKHLHDKFATSDISEISKKIGAEIHRILKDFKTFPLLSEDDQKYLRYGLFVDTIRNRIISELNTRTKTLVNGTQAYLSKLIRRNILNEFSNKGVNIKNISFFYRSI